MTGKKFAPQTFSSDEFLESLNAQCGSYDITGDGSASIQGHLSSFRRDNLDIAVVGTSLDTIIRATPNIKQDPADHFFFLLQEQGESVIMHNGTEQLISSGDMVIIDATKASEFRYKDDYSLQLSIQVNRDEVAHRYGKRMTGGLVIDKSDALGQAMRLLLQQALNDDLNANPCLGDSFYNVFGALLVERDKTSAQPMSVNEVVVNQALNTIASHFKDPQFNTQRLSELLNLSTRQLQRAFKQRGETPHSCIQKARLQAAFRALKAEQNGATNASVSRIAYDNGFNDLSTFYRLFKKHYSSAPGEI